MKSFEATGIWVRTEGGNSVRHLLLLFEDNNGNPPTVEDLLLSFK